MESHECKILLTSRNDLSLRETSWRKIECFLSFRRNLVEYFAPGDEQRIDKIWLEIFCKKINFEIKTGLQLLIVVFFVINGAQP